MRDRCGLGLLPVGVNRLELNDFALDIGRYANGLRTDARLRCLRALAVAFTEDLRESLDQVQHVGHAIHPVDVEGDGRGDELVAVPHVHFEAVAHVATVVALAHEVFSTLRLEPFDVAVECRVLGVKAALDWFVEHDVGAAFVNVQRPHIAGPERGEHRGERRKQDAADAGASRDTASVQRTVATVGQHRVVLDQAAARAQLLLDADGHLLVDGLLNHLGDLDSIQVEFVAERLVDHIQRTLLVQLNVTVGVVVRVEIAEHQVGIGNRGPQATAVVAGRARVASG